MVIIPMQLKIKIEKSVLMTSSDMTLLLSIMKIGTF
jgi:hypothetical protein